MAPFGDICWFLFSNPTFVHVGIHLELKLETLYVVGLCGVERLGLVAIEGFLA